MHLNNYFVEHIRGDLRWRGGGGKKRKKKLNKEVGSLAIYMHGPQGGPYGNFSNIFFPPPPPST